MCEALDDHEGSVSIGGRLITNFRCANINDIVVNAGVEEEAGVLVDRLVQPPQGTKWRLVQSRRKWRQTTQMVSKERSRQNVRR